MSNLAYNKKHLQIGGRGLTNRKIFSYEAYSPVIVAAGIHMCAPFIDVNYITA